MAQSVMISGVMRMHLWCADNWDILLMVSSLSFELLKNCRCIKLNIKHLFVCVGAIGISADEYFSEGLSPALLTSINCSGTESSISDCIYVYESRGHICGTAGVVCQGIYTFKKHMYPVL